MKMQKEMPAVLIAPCGINCGACYAYLRKRKPCVGCRVEEGEKPNYCLRCPIKACAVERGYSSCGECADLPCERIKHIDKRYRLRYQTGLIDNLRRLQVVGMDQYLKEEREKWTCAACGGVISLHSRVCSECGQAV